MKNDNMKRDHGRKELYFEDVKMAARFVNLYQDLFIRAYPAWTDGKFLVQPVETSRGTLYKLTFMMNHKDMDSIRSSIKTVKRSFARKDRGNYRFTREFVVC